MTSPNWTIFDGFTPPRRQDVSKSWVSVDAWQDVMEEGLRSRRAELVSRREDWDTAMGELGLRDPSAVDRRSLRVLRVSREEDWSDWLAHLIEDSREGDLARRLFAGGPPDVDQVREVRREVSSPEGWRADLVIEWMDGSYSHIEVKVGDPALDKTLQTAEAIERRFRGWRRRGDFILLLPEQLEDWELRCQQNPRLGERIAVLTWVDVACALRRSLRERVETVAWRVWAHTFCAAIEQKLLRIPARGEPKDWVSGLRFSRLELAHQLLSADRSGVHG